MASLSTLFIRAMVLIGVLTFAIAQEIDNVDKENDVNPRSNHGKALSHLPYLTKI